MVYVCISDQPVTNINTHTSAAAGVKEGPLGQFLQQGWTEPSTRYMLAPPISPDDIPGRVLEAIQRCVSYICLCLVVGRTR